LHFASFPQRKNKLNLRIRQAYGSQLNLHVLRISPKLATVSKLLNRLQMGRTSDPYTLV